MSRTVELQYSGKEAVIIPDARLVAEPGSTVKIPAELAESLLARDGWSRPEKRAAPKESE